MSCGSMNALRQSIIDFIERTARGPAGRRAVLAPLGAAFFLAVLAALVRGSLEIDRIFSLPAPIPPPWRWAAGGCLAAAGAALWAWSVLQFIRARGTPVPLSPPSVVIRDGPYRYCRNPMLGGVFLMLFGLGLLLGSAALTFILTPLFILASLLEFKLIEEPELEKRLGEPYRRYRAQTPLLIPGVGRLLRRRDHRKP